MQRDYYIMKMKKSKVFALCLVLTVFGLTNGMAQEAPVKETKKETPVIQETKKKEVRVKKHTILERYESGMVVPADERLRLKKERLAEIKRKRSIIDTMSISERKRRKLLQALYRNPLSDQLNKAIVDTKFEEEEDY